MSVWAPATIHLASFRKIVQAYKEQVQAQVVAQTQGVVLRTGHLQAGGADGPILEEKAATAI